MPGWKPPAAFRALFVGKLIPLHGVETILAAARLAPEIAFRVVGSGQLDALLHDRPANVEWVEWIDYELLPAELHAAGCALGVFGTSGKAGRVIPNKAFQALACGTPLVTADTDARTRAAARRRERAARPRRRRLQRSRPRSAGSRPTAGSHNASARAASRPTAASRARTCSGAAGAGCSRASSRDEGARRRLGGGRRLRGRLRHARGAPPSRLRERPLRPRKHDAGASGRPRTATCSR